MNDSIRVMIIDGFPIVRWAVRSYLEKETGINVVGEAASVMEASRIAMSVKPDVIITDIRFPGAYESDSPLNFVKIQQVPTLAFSDQDTWRDVEEFIQAGGLGFVSKRSPMKELISAIHAVSGNRQWISPGVRESGANNKKIEEDILSPREREVVSLIADGMTSKQIAEQLCLSLRTVENHRHRMFKKLGIRRSAQLVDYAIRKGLQSGAGFKSHNSGK
ncbi:MAG: response regulator transcription factor [Armatimonadota bacterium]|nr:response regulator transcription factor [bacterium]